MINDIYEDEYVSQPSSGNIDQTSILNTPDSSRLSSYDIEVITLDALPFKIQLNEARPFITTSNRHTHTAMKSDMSSGLPLVQDQPSAPITQDSQYRPIKKIKWVPLKEGLTKDPLLSCINAQYLTIDLLLSGINAYIDN